MRQGCWPSAWPLHWALGLKGLWLKKILKKKTNVDWFQCNDTQSWPLSLMYLHTHTCTSMHPNAHVTPKSTDNSASHTLPPLFYRWHNGRLFQSPSFISGRHWIKMHAHSLLLPPSHLLPSSPVPPAYLPDDCWSICYALVWLEKACALPLHHEGSVGESEPRLTLSSSPASSSRGMEDLKGLAGGLLRQLQFVPGNN